MNKKEELLRKFIQDRANMQERMLWIGCNPSNPEIFKKQTEEGFKVMMEMSNLARKYIKAIEESEIIDEN